MFLLGPVPVDGKIHKVLSNPKMEFAVNDLVCTISKDADSF